MQSRYYDPGLGRFINADGFTSTGQGLLGNNMFAYCGNNPIGNIDSTGMLFEKNAGGGWGGFAYAGPAGGHIVRPTTPSRTRLIIPFVPPSTSYGIDELRGETIAIRNGTYLRTDEAEKADAKIKSIVKKDSKARYWSANLRITHIDIGRPLTYSQAVKEVSKGRNVFAVTWWEAKAVAIAAGGRTGANNKSLIPEIHNDGDVGYYFHYHTYNRKGGHVYYLFGCL